MTTAILQPGKISGAIRLPASKSIMQRALAAALLRKGQSRLINPGDSGDDRAAISIIKQFGAKVEMQQNALLVTGADFSKYAGNIHCGESGLSARLFSSLAALSGNEVVITGEGSLLQRPFGFFENVFASLNVSCETNHGRLPLKLRGPLKPADISIDGSLSSQFLTGLIFAYAAARAEEVAIEVKDLHSKPYVDLTLQVLKDFGLPSPRNESYQRFVFEKQQDYDTSGVLDYMIESDWSSAAFLLVAAAVNGENVKLQGLNNSSLQGDRKIIDALQMAGARVYETNGELSVSKADIKGFDFDATDSPDLFPPLVALAAHATTSARIKGVHRLAHKESDRALTLKEEFEKTGTRIQIEGDEMMIEPGKLKGANVHSHNDHRIAMALAVAALGAAGEMVINGAGSVDKSYPGFWKDLAKLHALVSLSHDE